MNTGPITFGIDHLLSDEILMRALRGRRIGLVGHPASTTSGLTHTLDALIDSDLPVQAAFGPQHGMRGDKQDNMIESEDYLDERHHIPVYSLYGQHRRPTPSQLQDLDVIVIDLQDIGCRIYTYLTTLAYFIEACAEQGKSLWVLDRPNPAGRRIEGLTLMQGQESFVGCGPIPMRHGLTLGEFASWYADFRRLDLDLNIVELQGYDPAAGPGYGWPVLERAWVNPSPNAASLNMARCFPGTVLLEGTELSEGRGTTRPLELMGAPDLPVNDLLTRMHQLAPAWMTGAVMRPCYFEPTFHKHQQQLCSGIQIHTDLPTYDPQMFSAFRMVALLLKALRLLRPDYAIWRHHAYEYELDRIPIDVINGGPLLRQWVDDPKAEIMDLETQLSKDEAQWLKQTNPFYRY